LRSKFFYPRFFSKNIFFSCKSFLRHIPSLSNILLLFYLKSYYYKVLTKYDTNLSIHEGKTSMKFLNPPVDCHVHSSFSEDSSTTPQEAAAAAKSKGLLGITLTDHIDLDYPTHTADIMIDFEKRRKVIEETSLQENFKILNGIELGFQPHVHAQSAQIVKNHSFDFVINSTHVVDAVALCQPPYGENLSKKKLITRYLKAILTSIELFDEFDVVGHIGFICRYMHFKDKSLKYVDYADIIDAILKALIQKGKGLEANTAGYKYKLDTTHPGFDVLAHYKELGGEILTLGSDAHTPDQIGSKFDFVIEKLASIGFQYVTYFEKRKPIFVKII
jgi:histidinol-phosphatase (PHP family)